jgi:hypothetical protein
MTLNQQPLKDYELKTIAELLKKASDEFSCHDRNDFDLDFLRIS